MAIMRIELDKFLALTAALATSALVIGGCSDDSTPVASGGAGGTTASGGTTSGGAGAGTAGGGGGGASGGVAGTAGAPATECVALLDPSNECAGMPTTDCDPADEGLARNPAYDVCMALANLGSGPVGVFEKCLGTIAGTGGTAGATGVAGAAGMAGAAGVAGAAGSTGGDACAEDVPAAVEDCRRKALDALCPTAAGEKLCGTDDTTTAITKSCADGTITVASCAKKLAPGGDAPNPVVARCMDSADPAAEYFDPTFVGTCAERLTACTFDYAGF